MCDRNLTYPYVENEILYFTEDFIIGQFVEIKWHGNNRKHYESKGYVYTGHLTPFIVDVRDLSKGSHAIITAYCPVDMEPRQADWNASNIRGLISTFCHFHAHHKPIKNGEMFGSLKVTKKLDQDKWGNFRYICQCKCGNKLVVLGSSLKSGHTKSCRRGACNTAWKESLTDKDREIRNSRRRLYPGYKEWRTLIYKRDNYMCQVCYQKSNIAAHHYEDYSNNEDLQLDISNGITICTDCHYDFHINFMGGWAVSCTREDFKKWKSQILT